KCRHVFRPEELALVVAHDEQDIGACNFDGLGESVERLLGALYESRESRRIGFCRVRFAALRGEGVIRHQPAVERVKRAISPIILGAQRPVPRPEDEERAVRRADAEDDLRHGYMPMPTRAFCAERYFFASVVPGAGAPPFAFRRGKRRRAFCSRMLARSLGVRNSISSRSDLMSAKLRPVSGLSAVPEPGFSVPKTTRSVPTRRISIARASFEWSTVS